MTLIIVSEGAHAEEAIRAANDASREHPCRVIAVVRGNRRGANRLDAQVRVGGDAGASEVIVLRLYGQLAEHGDSVVVPFLLPDAPVVAWWPGTPPDRPSEDPIGRMAQRRITDAAVTPQPVRAIERAGRKHVPGDTDLAWSRITLWRGLLAAAFDQPPYEPVSSATVTGGSDSPSAELMAAGLARTLRCPVSRTRTEPRTGLISAALERESGPVELVRPDGTVATLPEPGQPARRISLPPRNDRDCLAEELRRLDPDDIYAEVLTEGFKVLHGAVTKAGRAGSSRGAKRTMPDAPSPVANDAPPSDAPPSAAPPSEGSSSASGPAS